MTRAYDWIASHALRIPDRIAAIDHHTGRRLTYREFDARISRLAGLLREEHGVGRGDRVAMLSPNSTDNFELLFACHRLGAIFLPLNWRLARPELEFICGDATPSLLVADRSLAAAADSLAPRILCWGGPESPYETALEAASPLARNEACDLGDVWVLMYTSGTTGRPKGALITYRMAFYNAVHSTQTFGIEPGSVSLTVLPTFHTAGLNLWACPCFHQGATTIVMRDFEPGPTLALLGDPQLGVTHFFGVPAIYLFLSQHPAFDQTDLSRLRVCGIGGAPSPLPLLESWAARGCALMQGYGMTETSPTVTVLTADRVIDKVGSCGQPVMHTEVRLVDRSGVDVPPGAVGELWVRGPNVISGYWNRPEENRSAFTEGWLHTGDAARIDSEGFYYIVDRWKDMYISGGENVYPAEVENAIFELPQVLEAAVIGVADDRWGEVGRAIVVKKPGTALTEQQVIEHCLTRLARFKVPRSVVFVKALPRNASGKVLKRQLGAGLGGLEGALPAGSESGGRSRPAPAPNPLTPE